MIRVRASMNTRPPSWSATIPVTFATPAAMLPRTVSSLTGSNDAGNGCARTWSTSTGASSPPAAVAASSFASAPSRAMPVPGISTGPDAPVGSCERTAVSTAPSGGTGSGSGRIVPAFRASATGASRSSATLRRTAMLTALR